MASFKSPSSRRWVENADKRAQARQDRREILETRRARAVSKREGTQVLEFTYLHPRARLFTSRIERVT